MTPTTESRLLTPLWIIAWGVIIAALYVGQLFLVPIVFAILLSIVLRPIVRTLRRRLRIPPTATAALLVLGIIAAMVGGAFLLAGPAERWWAGADASFAKAEERLRVLGVPLQKLTAMKDRLDHLGAAEGPTTTTASSTAPTTSSATSSAPKPTTAPAAVVQPVSSPPVATPSGVQTANAPAAGAREFLLGVFGRVSALVGGVAEVLFLTFLILSADGLFLHKLRASIEDVEDKSDARSVVHEAGSVVMRYLLVSLAINIGQATAVAIALWLIGMEHALLWAILTIVLEFVPYLGAAAMISLLSITALASFDSLGHALLVPAAYLLISNIQNNVVSPLLYGNHLKLNPVAILIGVIFFWFVWGIPGAFVAVPILAIARIACEKSERWERFGTFLADDSPAAAEAK